MYWPEGAGRRSAERDNENRLLQSISPLFHPQLPDPPKAFLGTGPLNFSLDPEERKFLRTLLLGTRRVLDGKPSYLAALVEARAPYDTNSRPWSAPLMKHADAEDKAALERARNAASLAAVARAVYNAMVEALKAHRDGITPSNRHREHLANVVAEHG